MSGFVHLLTKGGLSPAEEVTDEAVRQKQQAKIQRLIIVATRRLSKAENISISEANERLFAAPINRANAFKTHLSESEFEEYQKLLNKAASGLSIDRDVTLGEAITLLSGGDSQEANGLFEHLSDEELQEFFELQTSVNNPETQRKLMIKIATLMINFRLAYCVELISHVPSSSSELFIKPLAFPLVVGNKLDYEGTRIEITEDAKPGSEMIKVKEIPFTFEAGDCGYLVDEMNPSALKIGDRNWSEEDTEQLLIAPQILSLYEFYLKENAGEASEEDDEGKDSILKESSDSSIPSPSTGVKSTGGSNISELETKGSEIENNLTSVPSG